MADLMTERESTTRPIGVVVLTTLSAIALALAVLHLLQALGIMPYFIGSVGIHDFNLWYVLMWGLMVWVWTWVIQALWAVDPTAWLFLLVISGFNLMFDFFTVLSSGPGTAFTDLAFSFIVNLVIFGYLLLPGTKRSFGLS